MTAQSVRVREQPVEDDRVVGVDAGEILAGFAGGGDVHDPALLAEALGQEARRLRVVFDQEEPHGRDPSVEHDSTAGLGNLGLQDSFRWSALSSASPRGRWPRRGPPDPTVLSRPGGPRDGQPTRAEMRRESVEPGATHFVGRFRSSRR
jgi:hypothetical protein